jgi:hypothetical protein
LETDCILQKLALADQGVLATLEMAFYFKQVSIFLLHVYGLNVPKFDFF